MQYLSARCWAGSGLTQSDPVSSGLPVDPERHPGQHYQQTARHVHVDQKVPHVSSQYKIGKQHRVGLTCKRHSC